MIFKNSVIPAIICSVMFLCVAGNAQPSAQDDEIRKAMAGVRVDSVRFLDDLGMYEAVSSGQVSYLSRDLRYVFVGSIIDLKTRQNLTAERVNNILSIDYSALNKANAIKMGNGKTSIAVFTDPDCPFCKKFHLELKKLKDVTVYIYLYPLESLHPDAKRKSAAIWCSKNRVAAMDAWFAEVQPKGKQDASCVNPIEENIRVGREHRLMSVPAVVLESGRVITGYRDAAALAALILEKESAKK